MFEAALAKTVSDETLSAGRLSHLRYMCPPCDILHYPIRGLGAYSSRSLVFARMITHYQNNQQEFDIKVRRGLRASAISVSLLTTRDEEAGYHGLAATSAMPVSASPPCIIVAVDQAASAYPALGESGLFCLNHITSDDLDLLNRFCRSDMRALRFASNAWRSGLHGLPYLSTAISSFFCRVIGSNDYGNHTVFVGRIEGVSIKDELENTVLPPIIWMNGAPRRLAEVCAA